MLTWFCSYYFNVPSSHCKRPRSSIYPMSSEEISIFPSVVSLFKSLSNGCFKLICLGMTNSVVIYNVEIRNSSGDVWKLEKTFNDFYQLQQRIKGKFPAITRVVNTFPKKKMFSPNINSPHIEYRKKFFQAYLQALLQVAFLMNDSQPCLNLRRL